MYNFFGGGRTFVFHGIAYCVTHFNVPKFIKPLNHSVFLQISNCGTKRTCETKALLVTQVPQVHKNYNNRRHGMKIESQKKKTYFYASLFNTFRYASCSYNNLVCYTYYLFAFDYTKNRHYPS